MNNPHVLTSQKFKYFSCHLKMKNKSFNFQFDSIFFEFQFDFLNSKFLEAWIVCVLRSLFASFMFPRDLLLPFLLLMTHI